MLRPNLAKLLAGIAFTLPSIGWSALPDLTVHVINAKTDSGTIEVSLFDSADNFLKEVYLQQSGSVSENGDFSARFASLDEGEYAIVVVHDENSNQKYDAGFFGFGAEGLGYSNNIKPWFFRPTFEEVKFIIDSGPTEIQISLE